MIQITKHEAAALRKRFPTLPITRTAHKYYVEEGANVNRFLRGLYRVKERLYA